MHPSPTEWQQFLESVRKRTGIDLSQYKANQLQRRILGMAESRQAKSLAEFWQIVSASETALTGFLDRLAINVSELFRNPEKWEELRTKILPGLLRETTRFRAWSAGCSYGAEAYSLAVLLEEARAANASILGTDIDQSALRQAREGRFSESDMRGVKPEWRNKYFEKRGAQWFALPRLQKLVTFKAHNLLRDPFESGFDLILCRNVVIYFNDEAKSRLYAAFFEALKPGGVLFVGSTERIFDAKTIGFEQDLPFFYRKPQRGSTAWRNAS